MVIRVKLPNGQYGKFPDGTPHEQIESVIQKQFPPTGQQSEIVSAPFNERETQKPAVSEEPKGWKGLTYDAVENLRNAFRSGVGFIGRTPENIKGIKQEFKDNPLKEAGHIAGQLAVSLAESGKGLANLALLPLQDKTLQKLTGGKVGNIQIPETTGLQNLLGLQSDKKGDELIKTLPDIAGLTYGGTSLIGKGFRKLNKPIPLSKESRLRNAMHEKIIGSKKAHEKIIEDKKLLEESQKLRYAQEHGGEKIGSLNPVDQEIEALGKEAAIEAAAPIAKLPEEKVSVLPVAPDVKSAEKALADALESTRAHEKHGGRIYQDAIVADKEAASDLYNKYREHLSKSDIKLNNDAEIKDITNRLNEMKNSDELASGYGIGNGEQKELESQLAKLKSETVNAADVFSVKRTLDHMAESIRSKQFSGVSDEEFKQLRTAADKLESKSEKLGGILENVGGKEAQQMLKMANEGWSKYASVRNHAVGRKLLKEGILPSNTIGKLSSKSADKGTQRAIDYLNAIKDESPRLQKHILSQKYGKESQFKHLLNPKEEVEPYLANREDLHTHIENLRETKHAANEHKKLTEALKETANRQKMRAEANEKIDKLTKQVKLHRETADKLAAKIKEEKAAGKNTAKLEEDFARHKREYVSGDSRLTHMKSLLGKVIAGKIGYEVFFKQHD